MELAFYLSGFISVLATLCVITQTQPMYALIYLIISLLASACVLFSLGAYFSGALTIIIYAGAIMVLFVFGVIILDIGTDCRNAPEGYFWSKKWSWIAASLMAFAFLAILLYALYSMTNHIIISKLISIKTVGITLFGPYILVIELASMILLAGLVVALHLGRDVHKSNNRTL